MFWAAIIGALIVVAPCSISGPTRKASRAALRSALRARAALADAACRTARRTLDSQPPARLAGDCFAAGGRGSARRYSMYSISGWPRASCNVSGRLRRPWPDLPTLTLPASPRGCWRRRSPARFCPASSACCRRVGRKPVHGLCDPGICGAARDHPRHGEPRLALTGAYAAVIVFGWPMLAIVAARAGRNRLQYPRAALPLRKRDPPAGWANLTTSNRHQRRDEQWK